MILILVSEHFMVSGYVENSDWQWQLQKYIFATFAYKYIDHTLSIPLRSRIQYWMCIVVNFEPAVPSE